MESQSLQTKQPAMQSSERASPEISFLQDPQQSLTEMKRETHSLQTPRLLIDLNMATIDDPWAFSEPLSANASPTPSTAKSAIFSLVKDYCYLYSFDVYLSVSSISSNSLVVWIITGDAQGNALDETIVGRLENELLAEEASVEGEDYAEQVVEEEEYPGEADGVIQVKTEEVGEPLRSVKEKKRRKDYEIFVGGLDREAVEEDLERVFMRVGEVVEVRLVKQPNSNRNKGFAFVRFATVEQARRAAKELKFTQVFTFSLCWLLGVFTSYW